MEERKRQRLKLIDKELKRLSNTPVIGEDIPIVITCVVEVLKKHREQLIKELKKGGKK